MQYKGYNIDPDLTGYAPKHSTYHFYIDSEKVDGYGESIEDCKKQIDELTIISLEDFTKKYKSLVWFKPIERFNISGHFECMYDMYKEELKENPQLTVEEFTTNIISCPEMKEANEIIGVGLKNEIKENIVVGCNYHTIWQSDPRMRFVLVEVKDNKAKLKTRHTRKEFWTELKDLIFIKSNYNKNKAISLTKPHTNKQC